MVSSGTSEEEVEALLAAVSDGPSRWQHRAGDSTEDRVFRQVAMCLAYLVGGSGHLGSYVLDPESFALDGAEPVGDLTRFRFRVCGEVVTEFERDDREPEDLAGTIDLDGEDLVSFDDDGRVRIAPWRCMDQKIQRIVAGLRRT